MTEPHYPDPPEERPPVPPADGGDGLAGFYSYGEDERGFAYVGTEWTHFGTNDGTVPLPGRISALACAPDDPDTLYAVWVESNLMQVSADIGQTWTASTIMSATGGAPSIYSLHALAGGQVYLLQACDDASRDGIWRSLDDGLTWTRIVSFAAATYGGEALALGSTKLWWSERTAANTYAFRRANLDGSGIETLGTHAFGSTVFGVLVSAVDDTFALLISRAGQALWRLDDGGLTDIRPSALTYPWDAIPLSATTYVAVGTDGVSSDVPIYRSVDAGDTWTLVQTIDAAEGFAAEGTPDTYHVLAAVDPTRTTIYMPGNASPTVQALHWSSSNGGLTWTSFVNEAVPQDGDGFWTIYGPGGVVARPV